MLDELLTNIPPTQMRPVKVNPQMEEHTISGDGKSNQMLVVKVLWKELKIQGLIQSVQLLELNKSKYVYFNLNCFLYIK